MALRGQGGLRQGVGRGRELRRRERGHAHPQRYRHGHRDLPADRAGRSRPFRREASRGARRVRDEAHGELPRGDDPAHLPGFGGEDLRSLSRLPASGGGALTRAAAETETPARGLAFPLELVASQATDLQSEEEWKNHNVAPKVAPYTKQLPPKYMAAFIIATRGRSEPGMFFVNRSAERSTSLRGEGTNGSVVLTVLAWAPCARPWRARVKLTSHHRKPREASTRGHNILEPTIIALHLPLDKFRIIR